VKKPIAHPSDAAPAWLPWLTFAAVSIIWGSTWLAHKWALADLTPIGLLAARLAFAGPLCLLIGILRAEAWPASRELPAILLAGLILTGVANVATSWSLNYLPSGIGAILQAPIPVWMALMAFRSDPLSALGWCAVLLGLLGVTVVMWPGERVHFPVLASIVCAAAALAWAWASLFQRARVRSGGLFINAGLQMTQGAIVGAVLIGFGLPWQNSGKISLEAVLAVAYLVVFGSCIAFASFVYLTKVWHPARATSFSYLNPMIAVLLGVWIGQEVFTNQHAVGLVLILASVMTLQLAARSKAAVPAIDAQAIAEAGEAAREVKRKAVS
jgi:drug/metabolite transporter (DMT)-like permease